MHRSCRLLTSVLPLALCLLPVVAVHGQTADAAYVQSSYAGHAQEQGSGPLQTKDIRRGAPDDSASVVQDIARSPEPDTIDAYFDAPYGPEYERTMEERIKAQINRYFDGYNERIADRRERFWQRDLDSWAAYEQSIESNRSRFRTIIGIPDDVGRATPGLESFGSFQANGTAGRIGETDAYTIDRVRWDIGDGITGEGLLVTPKHPVHARVISLPDADQPPAGLQGVARLARSGVQVLVPALIDRATTFSGSDRLVSTGYWLPDRTDVVSERYTNQPHREWVYRHAYPMGRHPIGYEVRKVQAALDWFEDQGDQPLGVTGYGEGGLIAFYTAAVDRRIDAVLVSGYFGPRENLWEEPFYRNVWGLLREFGDAEIGSMIAPRPLIVEYSEVPDVTHPPPQKGEGRGSRAAADGRLRTPALPEIEREVERLRGFFGNGLRPDVTLIHGAGDTPTGPGSDAALAAFAERLGVGRLDTSDAVLDLDLPERYLDDRQKRQVEQILQHLRRDMHHLSDVRRYEFLRGDLSSPRAWDQSMTRYRDYLYDEVIGRLEEEPVEPNPRMRQVFDEEHWTGYEVVLDVLPGVIGWGLLAVPKDLDDGERRPTVVVQHGHLGIPTTPVRIASYNRILPKLTERGFVVFAPHNPYQFNVRKATPLKASVFSVLIPQHQQIVRWLQTLPYVDSDRIGFYGKSWGGRSALRIPPFVPEYGLSISSAYFNHWPRKVLDADFHHSILYNNSIGLYEFNQLNTFGHAEMAMLIAPRPFMVENGYQDTIKPDEWAGYEFAKVKRLYDWLGIGERAVFGAHIGGHEVHADTILPFLHRYLRHPVPATE